MANWITLRQAAEKYETTVKDVLSWSELPEITFTYVNYTLLLNDDSVCDFIKLHSLPAEAGKDYGCAITFENVEIIAKLYANALEKIRLLEKQTELLNECVSKQSKLFESIEERLAAMLVSMGDTEIQDTDPINEESKFAAFMKKILSHTKNAFRSSIFHLLKDNCLIRSKLIGWKMRFLAVYLPPSSSIFHPLNFLFGRRFFDKYQ